MGSILKPYLCASLTLKAPQLQPAGISMVTFKLLTYTHKHALKTMHTVCDALREMAASANMHAGDLILCLSDQKRAVLCSHGEAYHRE